MRGVYPTSYVDVHDGVVILIVIPPLFPELCIPSTPCVSYITAISGNFLYGAWLSLWL
jgi:hypothetical protein